MQSNPAVATAKAACSAQLPFPLTSRKSAPILSAIPPSYQYPIASFGRQLMKADLALAWLRADGKVAEAPVQTVTIPPGRSTIENPLPIESSSIWTRLRYSLTPTLPDARAFPPTFGILSFNPHRRVRLRTAGQLCSVPWRGLTPKRWIP